MKKVFLFICVCVYFLSGCKSTGKTPSKEARAKLNGLPNYHDGVFHNIDTVPADFTPVKFTRILKEMRQRDKNVRPPHPLPSVKTDLIHTVCSKPTIIWFGHSSFLIKSATSTILVDPVFSDYVGPSPFRIKAFDDSISYSVDDLPDIDVLIISHNHYDHLDYNTILKLKTKVKKIIVPLGVGVDFIYWGYDAAKIKELNWYDSVNFSGHLKIIATPARHRSGRLFSEDKTLWASYVIEIDGYRFYYSGDTGYGTHFAKIGAAYGPFNLALLECGQYNKNWPYTHMFPEQTAQAGVDLHAHMIIPVHWGKFAESMHPWNESVRRLVAATDSLHIPVCIPEIGQPYTIGDSALTKTWWAY